MKFIINNNYKKIIKNMGTSNYFCPGNEKTITQADGLNLSLAKQLQSHIDSLRLKYRSEVQKMKNQPMPYGKVFRGTIINGRKNGYGELYNGTNAYFGMFENDKPHGQGLLIKQFKDFISGNFVQGKPDGQVTQKINQVQFQGHYYNGQKTKGVVKTQQYLYQGSFKNNKFSGYGIIQFYNGDRYQGDFLNGLYHGYGQYYTKQQGSYHGQFKNGLYDGKGKFLWNQDCYYQGQYKNGFRNGFGKFSKGKQQFQGFWINGQPQNNSKLVGSQLNYQSKIKNTQ